jgi:hypothetical protein
VPVESLTEPGMKPRGSGAPRGCGGGGDRGGGTAAGVGRVGAARPASPPPDRPAQSQQSHELSQPARHSPRDRPSWLREGVRVRVVSQQLARGHAYLSKATILSVVGPAACCLMLDSGSVLEVRRTACTPRLRVLLRRHCLCRAQHCFALHCALLGALGSPAVMQSSCGCCHAGRA